MRRKVLGFLAFVTVAFILSCQNNKEPNYPVTPYVEFQDLKYSSGNNNQPDTLKLKLYLRDGDFDLGLDYTDSLPPFNTLFVLNKLTGELIPVNDIPTDHTNLVLYPDRKKIDTLPSLSCSRWLFPVRQHAFDTVYYQPNRNHYNTSLNLYYQDTDLSWKYFDFNSYFKINNVSNCPPEYFFDARFIQPKGNYIIGPFVYKAISSKEGILTYSMTSFFSIFFKEKKIKLDFYIQDRALHRSNVVESSEIQL